MAVLLLHAGHLTAEESSNNRFHEAEITNGERLFMETRFAYHFFRHITDNNAAKPDKNAKSVNTIPDALSVSGNPPGVIEISCRTCHLVDEHLNQKGQGMRAYNDFAARSPVLARQDNQVVTMRNSPMLVDSALPRENLLLHYDGEFANLNALIIGTLTGRNMGWLPAENEIAVNHICHVIKNDNGESKLAKDFGGLSYSELFSGQLKSGELLPVEYLINPDSRFDVSSSSCDKILQGVSHLIGDYIIDLKFNKKENGISPYDLFLTVNKLPLKPDEGESDQEYTNRLLSLIVSLQKNSRIKFVNRNPNTKDGGFRFHQQPYRFGQSELQGLFVFFNTKPSRNLNAGNCAACHPAPHFTDFSFHNVGTAQMEYEAIHGQNSFNRLNIPTLAERNKNPDKYLPANKLHPDRKGLFRQIASRAAPHRTDLGAWNILFNEDYPDSQDKLYNALCMAESNCRTDADALKNAIATFKTPSLINLGHTAPYMHNGRIKELKAVMGFYIAASINSRRGVIRNASKELETMNISSLDIQPLVNFMNSLNVDYN
jgi:cytochrome c peroxidase